MDRMDIPEGLETTGRYIVTLRDGAEGEAMAMFADQAGIKSSSVMMSSDFEGRGVEMSEVDPQGGLILQNIGIAVLNAPPEAANELAFAAEESAAILAVEPEGVMYAIQEGLTLDYLRGFSDATARLLKAAEDDSSIALIDSEAMLSFADTAQLTWGLQATKVAKSKYDGAGIRVAVLDTGLFIKHPDFAGRQITGRSFIPGVASFNDGHGHGTHCTGTACGMKKPTVGRRYGVAHKSSIFIGKVLSDQGSGSDGGILAGIDWAVANRCEIISMSLGANVPNTSVAYETAGQRALNRGSLIIAAAGNNANRPGNMGFVGRPANSRTFMAVGALDSNAQMGFFSARDTALQPGTAVDIAGPGVAVYSSWPMPQRYHTISGTSMATPHVSGIAALWAQKSGARGGALWHQLIANARTLPLPIADVGRGFVQAP
jgi:subtilisin family serine protease